MKQSQPQVTTQSGAKPVGLKEYLKCKTTDLKQTQIFLEKIYQKETEKNQLACIKEKMAVRKKKLSMHYVSCSGLRLFSELQTKCLLSAAEKSTGDVYQQKQWMNEIAYAVRFGNLQVSYLTQKLMSVQHSLNIALKLLRENRWETPQCMKQVA